MTKKILAAAFMLLSAAAFGQINTADSTAQVITYWEKGEKQNYSVTHEKVKLKGVDTTSRELTTYDVEIEVLDQTDTSYTVQWVYKNLKTTHENPVVQRIMNITQDMRVVFRTSELGAFMEVLNGEEIKDYISKAALALKNEFKTLPEMDKVLAQIEATYSSKKAIESASIKDILQFHTFHGAKYKLGEILEAQIKVPNIYGEEPFDSEVTLYLDEIDEEDNNFIMRATEEINQEQLTAATFSYLTTLAKNINANPPKREDIENLKNEILTASRIHGTGWIVYSVQTTTVSSGDQSDVEERIIEIK